MLVVLVFKHYYWCKRETDMETNDKIYANNGYKPYRRHNINGTRSKVKSKAKLGSVGIDEIIKTNK